jgi:hypothetical protein
VHVFAIFTSISKIARIHHAIREANLYVDEEGFWTEHYDKSMKEIMAMKPELHDSGLIRLISTLPHLTTLDWRTMGPLDQRIAGIIVTSAAVKHLLVNGYVKPRTRFPTGDGLPWPLQSLDIEIIEEEESSFANSLLQACSPTLQSLTLRNEL